MMGAARHTDPSTSHAAAATIGRVQLEKAVVEALRKPEARNGYTSEQLAEVMGLSLVTVSPRMKPLETQGLVYRDGKRSNRSGAAATVWKAVKS